MKDKPKTGAIVLVIYRTYWLLWHNKLNQREREKKQDNFAGDEWLDDKADCAELSQAHTRTPTIAIWLNARVVPETPASPWFASKSKAIDERGRILIYIKN